ncbi:hypothetical protein [Saccharothrix luteola]|uniref:hypothetical protein n=1 Tax=Saccharothrix luteola TaxID=2893018 RepID=UPI001E60A04E|nr:hypothetical protein [Saccharothrix luteola]MCC8246241.1 hypothetical protein [Saccharothrix luteola]
MTLRWATVATALGGTVSEDDGTGPLDRPGTAATSATGPPTRQGDPSEPEVRSPREIALRMRTG